MLVFLAVYSSLLTATNAHAYTTYTGTGINILEVTSYGSGDGSIDEPEINSVSDCEATHTITEDESSGINTGMYNFKKMEIVSQLVI